MDASDRIQIGVVGKPHGVRGAFFLNGSVDSAALQAGLKLVVGEGEYTVAAAGGTEKRPILTLAEVDDRDAAVELRDRPVFAARGDLTPLAENEWFAEDLVGLQVVTDDGEKLGEVRRLRNLPSVDALEVAREGADDLMLPMVSDAISSISVDQGVVVDGDFLALDADDS